MQNLRYTATFPILINVSNQPTYFMSLKDGEGLVKKFAMVNIQSYQIVAIGDTVAQCQTNYINLLATNGIDVSSSQEVVAGTQKTGTIASITSVVRDGNTHFYLTLEGSNEIYDFSILTLPEIILYHTGDALSFTYIEDNENSVRYVAQTLGQ